MFFNQTSREFAGAFAAKKMINNQIASFNVHGYDARTKTEIQEYSLKFGDLLFVKFDPNAGTYPISPTAQLRPIFYGKHSCLDFTKSDTNNKAISQYMCYIMQDFNVVDGSLVKDNIDQILLIAKNPLPVADIQYFAGQRSVSCRQEENIFAGTVNGYYNSNLWLPVFGFPSALLFLITLCIGFAPRLAESSKALVYGETFFFSWLQYLLFVLLNVLIPCLVAIFLNVSAYQIIAIPARRYQTEASPFFDVGALMILISGTILSVMVSALVTGYNYKLLAKKYKHSNKYAVPGSKL